jgi:hypothetical protein
VGVHDFGQVLVLDEGRDLIQAGGEEASVVSNQGYSDFGLLPEVVVLYFGHRGLKAMTYFFDETSHHLALALERVIVMDDQGKPRYGHDHAVPSLLAFG